MQAWKWYNAAEQGMCGWVLHEVAVARYNSACGISVTAVQADTRGAVSRSRVAVPNTARRAVVRVYMLPRTASGILRQPIIQLRNDCCVSVEVTCYMISSFGPTNSIGQYSAFV